MKDNSMANQDMNVNKVVLVIKPSNLGLTKGYCVNYFLQIEQCFST